MNADSLVVAECHASGFGVRVRVGVMLSPSTVCQACMVDLSKSICDFRAELTMNFSSTANDWERSDPLELLAHAQSLA